MHASPSAIPALARGRYMEDSRGPTFDVAAARSRNGGHGAHNT